MNKEEVLYQIVAVDSEFKKGFPEESTTILKNGITGKTYADYDFKNHRYLYCFINDNFNIYDRLQEKDKEIERLNNIINELEKWLKDDENNLIHYDYESKYDYIYVDELLDKLKELKGE